MMQDCSEENDAVSALPNIADVLPDLPHVMDSNSLPAEEQLEYSDLDLARRESTLGELPADGTFKKKKKKKRVGGIAFAVQVEEQVIPQDEAELQQNREHWQSIQDKVNDPNTVYSNDTSKNPSGNSSPLRPFTNDSSEWPSTDVLHGKTMSLMVSVTNMLDHQELGTKLAELVNAPKDRSPRTWPPQDVFNAQSEAHSAPPMHLSKSSRDTAENVSCEPDSSNTVNLENESKRQREQQEREEQEEERMQFLRSSGNLCRSPDEPRKRDPASEPPSAGCPSLATPSLDAYVSDKDKDDLFKFMARGLLEYIGCFPVARKAPIPAKSHEDINKSKSIEERDREERLRAKAVSKRKGREEKIKKKDAPPLPPKNEKTALDFEYAIRRWLERSWKAGLSLTNAYHIGELMEADVNNLFKGQMPILESKLDTVWNGYGFEVKSVPLADVSEWDWRDLARRLKHQHLIGEKFFPSEEYHPQLGLDAMRVAEHSDHVVPAAKPTERNGVAARTAIDEASRKRAAGEALIERESIHWTKNADFWEDSTHVGLSADFAASTQQIRWDYDEDEGDVIMRQPHRHNLGYVNTHGVTGDDKSSPSTSQTLLQFVETSKKEWLNTRQESGGRSISRANSGILPHPTDMQPPSTSTIPRCTSEPIFSNEVKKGGKKRRELTEEQRQKQIEEEKAFRRFIKLHTGRTRVSQRKMQECREPFRLYKLQQKRIAAIGYYGGVLDEMEQEFQEIFNNQNDEDDDDDFLSDEKMRQKALIAQLFPAQGIDDNHEKENNELAREAIVHLNFIPKPKEKVREKKLQMPMADRLRVGSSLMNEVESSFAERRMKSGKREVASMLQSNIEAEADAQLDRDNELSFDEFLRRPMKVNLGRDPHMIKSLRLYSAMVGETGLNELATDKSRLPGGQGLSGRPLAGKRLTKLPGLRASGGGLGLPHLGRPEMVRSETSMDYVSDRQSLDASHLSYLDPLIPLGGVPRRDGIMSQGSQQFSTSGFSLSRSPYAQKMPSRPEAKKRSSSSNKHTGDWQPKFSKIASQESAAQVLAHIPVK